MSLDTGAEEAGRPGENPRAAREHTYESAVARVEEIIGRLDSGEASLTETVGLLGEGRDLIELCARELDRVGRNLEELRLDELVAQLEASRMRS